MTTLVVLPSYNERLNIVELTEAILEVDVATKSVSSTTRAPMGPPRPSRKRSRAARAGPSACT